jgi:hypothetical protein
LLVKKVKKKSSLHPLPRRPQISSKREKKSKFHPTFSASNKEENVESGDI